VSSPTNINLNDLLPPPKPDSCNAEVQAGIAYPDVNSPGNWVRDTSLCYRYPPVGGIFVIDDTFVDPYQVSLSDSGQTLIVNRTSTITLQLDSAVPAFNVPAQGVWNVKIKNLGTADITIDPNGLLLDGSAVSLLLAQNSGFELSTDGTGYWTYGNFGGGGGAIPTAIAVLFADAEVPGGTINGSNTAFTLANSPDPSGSLELYLNGQFQTSGTDYTLSGNAITMTVAPSTGDSLLAFYRYGSSGGLFVDDETPSGTINGSNTVFTLANVPNPASSVEVFLDGMMQRAGVDYSLSSATVTFTSAPISGAILRAYYRFISATAYNFVGEEGPAGTVNSSNTVFTLAHSPSPVGSLKLFLNGILQKRTVDYTLSGSTITFTTAPTTGDTLYAFYRW